MSKKQLLFIAVLMLSFEVFSQTNNCENYENILENMSDESLGYRTALRDTIIKYGYDSPKRFEAIKSMVTGDSLLLLQFNKLVDECGFRLGKEMSEKSWNGAFLVIAHSNDLATLIKYCELMKNEAISNKQLNPNLATLIDRILIAQNERQLYGTQYGSNKFPGYILPIRDFSEIDERRSSMGLITFEEFIKERNLKYDDSLDMKDFFNTGQ